MNKVSKFLDRLGTNGKKYAALVERLVRAAEFVERERMTNEERMQKTSLDVLHAALAAIQGGEVGNE